MKQLYCIVNFYGLYLTSTSNWEYSPNPAKAYTFDSKEKAEKQLDLFEKVIPFPSKLQP